MTLSEKLERLIEDSGWSMAEVARRIGRDSNQQLLRWMGRAGTGRPPKEAVRPKNDGSERRGRESAPDRYDLIGLSDLFGVDIRWLIDDKLGWDDQLKADNPILTQIRRLSMEDQLAMWTWHSGRDKNGTQPGSTSYPKEKPPTRPHRNNGGQPKRGMNARGV